MIMALYTRSQWGAAPAKRAAAPVSGMDGFAVHHLGSDNYVAPTTVEGAMAALRAIQSSHLDHPTEDYSDIAYNVAVDQLGNRYVLRGMDRKGGATYGANDHVLACLWIGDSRFAQPTRAALEAIATWYQVGVRDGSLVNGAAIGGHRDWTQTSCPGDVLYAMLPTIRALAGGQTIDTDDPLILNPATEEPDMDANQAAQLKAVADVLAPQWPRIGRAATMADLAEMSFDNFVKLGAAAQAQTATNQQIIALLQSIDARLAGSGPATDVVPTAAELVDAFLERLGRS